MTECVGRAGISETWKQFFSVLLSSCSDHAATWQRCLPNNRAAAVVAESVTQTCSCSYARQEQTIVWSISPTTLSLCVYSLCQGWTSIVFPFPPLRRWNQCCALVTTHLDCQQAVCVRKDSIRVNMTLEPSENKKYFYHWQSEIL